MIQNLKENVHYQQKYLNPNTMTKRSSSISKSPKIQNPSLIQGIYTLATIKIAYLSNSWCQNCKVCPKRSTKNGHFIEKAKRPVCEGVRKSVTSVLIQKASQNIKKINKLTFRYHISCIFQIFLYKVIF